MFVAWASSPKDWRLGRYQTYGIHPLTGREIVLNDWWCLGPLAVSLSENDPFEPTGLE